MLMMKKSTHIASSDLLSLSHVGTLTPSYRSFRILQFPAAIIASTTASIDFSASAAIPVMLFANVVVIDSSAVWRASTTSTCDFTAASKAPVSVLKVAMSANNAVAASTSGCDTAAVTTASN